jgi:hypothetical protein
MALSFFSREYLALNLIVSQAGLKTCGWMDAMDMMDWMDKGRIKKRLTQH